ncbi:hypothetical protein PGS49_03335 [Yersinia intermedia]|uniref:hypothetical protein n=1 Tax=Yersinia intermedia TaxID=631 RepID=UPI0022FDD8C0|nr:hypothetical protein [Yersinia intermedia]MDA5479694.1 hypothetical protein [Yersinia intermedia]
MLGKMVLDDSLLVVYENAKQSKKFKLLMRRFSHPYATNWRQWNDATNIGLNIPSHTQTLAQLAQRPEKNDDLVTLASKTTFKIILTEDENKLFPYVYYKSKMVTKSIIFSLSSTDSRQALVTYLQMMCANANKITICDNYFAQNWEVTKALFYQVLPRQELLIEYAEAAAGIDVTRNSENITNDFLHSICKSWSTKLTNLPKYSNCHDRYLLIESQGSKIEVMLSSGFDHIWKINPKEITCIFSEVVE